MMYTINEEKAIVKSITTNSAKIQAYDIRLLDYHNYYLNDILLGDSTKRDITNIYEDKQIIESKVGVLIDQTIATELVRSDSGYSSFSFQLLF